LARKSGCAPVWPGGHKFARTLCRFAKASLEAPAQALGGNCAFTKPGKSLFVNLNFVFNLLQIIEGFKEICPKCVIIRNSNMTPDIKQIFSDKTGRRKIAFRIFTMVLFALSLIIISCMAGSIIINNRLPELTLQEPRFVYSPGEDNKVLPEPNISPLFNRHPHSASVFSTKRYAFLIDFSESSMASLKRNIQNLDVLIAAWVTLSSPEGDIKVAPDAAIRAVTKVTEGIASPVKVLPLISDQDNENENETAVSRDVVSSPQARSKFLSNLTNFIESRNLGGAVISFSHLKSSNYADYVEFLKEIATAFKGRNWQLAVSVPLHDAKFDYDTVANTAGYIILNIFDEHSQPTQPGPIAGQAWFERQLDERLRTIDEGKVIIAIGSYAYEWINKNEVREISVQEAWDLGKISQAKPHLESTSLNTFFSYSNPENGEKHSVWLLDAITAYNQTAAALAMDVHGVALWKLGTEDPGVWTFFQRGRIPDVSVLEELKTVHSGYDVVYRGKGEALRVTGSEKTGERQIKYDSKPNLITEASLISFPESLTVTRWGATKAKKLALTFDDGPDPRYTQRILDVLAEKNVKATFFVIGGSASSYPSILKKVFNAGHDIGNHTFTHPNLSLISRTQIELELNATQKLLEATLGITTLLFRPPYAEDIEPQTTDHAQSLFSASELGYTTIGMKIDPHDWALPTKGQIVTQVVAQANQGAGNIVLLHDAGGNREQTIQALSELIDRLRAQGYEFVTVHELLNLDREAVMPHIRANYGAVMKFNAIGFKIIDYLGTSLSTIFIAALVLSATRLVVIGGAAIVHWRRSRRRDHVSWQPSKVAVLVPAYNERETVCKTIRSLLASTVRNLEVIVVDDGSKDDTLKILKRSFKRNNRVRIHTKPNGGKASALNFALQKTSADIVITLDADTIFEPAAIELLVRHFQDPAVGAVAGAVFVGNQNNLITKLQALEYIVSQNFDRRALEMVNGITVVPGAIGAWRRQAILDVGGFPANTLAEDADATITLECNGWKVLAEPNAVACTEAPETVKAFLKQRLRWTFGLLQVAFKHRKLLGGKRAPGVAYCAIPNIVLFQYLLVLISPVMDLALIWNVIVVLVATIMHPTEPTPLSFADTLRYWLALQTLELAASALALALDRTNGTWKLLPYLLIQRFGYKQLLAWIAYKTTLSIVMGQAVGWGKLARTGNAALPQTSRLAQGQP
jgi:peptidoglycan-N-acetylglucosamine deacetylase